METGPHYNLVIEDDVTNETTDDTQDYKISFIWWDKEREKFMTEFYPKPEKGGEKDMMGLYQVYIVDTKKNIVLHTPVIIAKSEDRAKMKAVKLDDIDMDNDYIEVFVDLVGQWGSKKPKEVKIVKEE